MAGIVHEVENHRLVEQAEQEAALTVTAVRAVQLSCRTIILAVIIPSPTRKRQISGLRRHLRNKAVTYGSIKQIHIAVQRHGFDV